MAAVPDSRFAAVVVAAGRGSRFGGDKHALEIDGIPLWKRGADVLAAAGADPVIVVGGVPGGVPGGQRRRDSVANGLAHVGDAEWVLVHDAARPAITVELVQRVMATALQGNADGVVPGVPVTNTIKQIEGSSVVATPDRSSLRAIQTPQAFRVAALIRAHRADDGDATDDAALIERAGGSIVVVDGDPDNLKVTFPEDLERVTRVIEGRRS